VNTAPTATELSIDEASQKAASGAWLDALQQYQRILDTAPNDLVPVTPSRSALAGFAALAGPTCWMTSAPRTHWRPARWVCHLHLSQLAPAGLTLYRERVDGQALKRFQQAKLAIDDRPLEDFLADFFCSTSSEDAVLLLANRAFERGELERAQFYWSTLHPLWDPHSTSPKKLTYPNPKSDPAAIRARLILVKLFRRESADARRQMAFFRNTYADAKGLLAGRDGKYVETLDRLLAPANKLQTTLPEAVADRWTTMGNSPARNSFATGKLPYYWPDQPTWKNQIPSHRGARRTEADDVPPPTDHPRGLAFQPVIAHGRAFIADATTVYSFDLMTGERAEVYKLPKKQIIPGLDGRLPVRSPLRYTLTFANDHLYARLGAQTMPSSADEGGGDGQNYSCIVCLPVEGSKERWLIEPPASMRDSAPVFEGAPVVAGDRIYALVARIVGGDAITTIVCYQNSSDPEVLWQKDVGKSPQLPAAGSGRPLQVLTLTDSRVLYCNNSGSILAVDSRSGQFLWAYQYRHLDRPTARLELSPCVYAGGQVFAAPTDSNCIYCLDVNTGRPIWEHEGVEGVQFLGITHELCVCSVRGSVKGIRAIDERGNAAWIHHDDGGESTFGSGFVSADVVFWPTKHGLQFLRPDNGTALRAPLPGPLGNLCYADGFLIVATPTEVWGYVAERHFLNARKRAVEEDAADMQSQLKLAMAEADAGLFTEAKKRFQVVAGNQSYAAEARERWRQLVIDRFLQAVRDNDRQMSAAILNDPDVKNDDEIRVLLLLVEARAALAAKDLELAGKLLVEIEKMSVSASVAILDGAGSLRGIAALAAAALESLGEIRQRKLVPEAIHSSGPTETGPKASFFEKKQVAGPVPNLLPLASMNGKSAATRFASAGRDVYRLDTTKARIDRVGTAPFWPKIAEELQDHIVVAAAEGVAALGRKDGKLHWQFIPSGTAAIGLAGPFASISPALRSAREPTTPPRLSSFKLVAGKIYFLVDRREFVCLNATDGSPAWSSSTIWRRSTDRLADVYLPHYQVTSTCLIAQRSTGEMGIIVAGAARDTLPATTREPWLQDPIPVGNDGVILALDPETVICLQLYPKRLIWKKSISYSASASGEYPQLRLHHNQLLVKWSRNHGHELDCLDSNTGARLWKKDPIFLGTTPCDLNLAGIDDTCVYLSSAAKIQAIALDNGKMLDRFSVPGTESGTWKIHALPSTLLVHPTLALPRPTISRALEWNPFSWDLPWIELIGSLRNRYDGWRSRTLPVLVMDKQNGQLRQRLSLPGTGPAASVGVMNDGIYAFTGEHAYWLSAKEEP
jgi:outer membrane protein assembly factor BamB